MAKEFGALLPVDTPAGNQVNVILEIYEQIVLIVSLLAQSIPSEIISTANFFLI